MKPAEYNAICNELGWSHGKVARVIGVDDRTPYRYAAGDIGLKEPTARLLRVLVWAKLTLSRRKFDELVQQLEKRHGKEA